MLIPHILGCLDAVALFTEPLLVLWGVWAVLVDWDDVVEDRPYPYPALCLAHDAQGIVAEVSQADGL